MRDTAEGRGRPTGSAVTNGNGNVNLYLPWDGCEFSRCFSDNTGVRAIRLNKNIPIQVPLAEVSGFVDVFRKYLRQAGGAQAGGTLFSVHPLMCGYSPVNRVERDGVHTGWVT